MLFCTSMISVVGLGDGRLRVSSRNSSDSDFSSTNSGTIPKGMIFSN